MVVWFGLEDELIQQPHDLIRTKRNNTEHQMRLDFLVSTHAPASGALQNRP